MISPFRLEFVSVRNADNTFRAHHDCQKDTGNYARIPKVIFRNSEVTIDYWYISSKEHRNLWLRQTFVHENKFLQDFVTPLRPLEARCVTQHSIAHVLAPDSPAFAETSECVIMLTEIFDRNSLLCEFALILDDY
ncbi:hypothetical protein Zmor_016059 [Zophobas morio]|uniref:Uncharacterized protein n=1 Tax=Zophobas morio TaxID=2755281 RepID=A0AA38MI82_9CUCU|nr:hypothetical protein Zmor_016059 [Zophobas morio]